MNNKIIDTLIIERNGRYMIESYQGQDLDNYDYDVELNHNELLYCKEQDRYFMKDITIKQILDYIKNFDDRVI